MLFRSQENVKGKDINDDEDKEQKIDSKAEVENHFYKASRKTADIIKYR